MSAHAKRNLRRDRDALGTPAAKPGGDGGGGPSFKSKKAGYHVAKPKKEKRQQVGGRVKGSGPRRTGPGVTGPDGRKLGG